MSRDSDRKSRDLAADDPTKRREEADIAADEQTDRHAGRDVGGRSSDAGTGRPADAEAGRKLPRGTDETPER
jgi:hypothetical protein